MCGQCVGQCVSAHVNDKCILGCEGRRRGLFEAALEVGGSHVSSAQRALDVLLEQTPVGLQHLRCLLVQRIFRIGLLRTTQGLDLNTAHQQELTVFSTYQEQILQSVYDGVNGQHGLPVFSETQT